jgi:hypothetical protein
MVKTPPRFASTIRRLGTLCKTAPRRIVVMELRASFLPMYRLATNHR